MTDAQKRAAGEFKSYRKRGLNVGPKKKCKYCPSKTANRFGICNHCRSIIMRFYDMTWLSMID